ncbi:MAG TPA: molybdenum ABC transporter ATP-binding protein [Terriglobia bacterium]
MAAAPVAQVREGRGIGSPAIKTEIVETGGRGLKARISKRLEGGFTLEAEFHAPPGFTILFGPSGSGKTTLLHSIAGLYTPDAGFVALGPRVLFDSERKIDVPVPERSVGYLFQDLALFPHLTAEENVEYGIARIPAVERHERAGAILKSFRIESLKRRKPGEISGGERQRVALARSLVTDPAVLLLDEPLSALDASVKSQIIHDLKAWNAASAIPIVYVTHSAGEAFALGERVIVLESGRILAQGTPQQVFAAPRHETIAQLAGFENIFDATVTALREEQGVMRCRLKGSDVELEVPLGRATTGSEVRVAIRAGDIMVAATRPRELSARNIFKVNVMSLERQGVMVIASVESGVKFEAHLTPSASQELSLQTGQQVWLVIKTYSCHLVDRPT